VLGLPGKHGLQASRATRQACEKDDTINLILNSRAAIGRGIVLALILVLSAAAPVFAEPATVPAEDTPAPSRLDSIELKRSSTETSPRRDGAATSSATSAFGLWRVLLAVAIVTLVILALRWLGRRFLGLPASPGAAGPLQVLYRSTLGPRQQLLLIQLGRRLVLAANSATQVNPLCEITDPEEVSQLIGQIQQRRQESVTNSFMALIGRANAQYDAPEPSPQPATDPDPSSAVVAATRREITGLAEKIRTLSQALRRV
jgi:flagellar biogenesis protein FliO